MLNADFLVLNFHANPALPKDKKLFDKKTESRQFTLKGTASRKSWRDKGMECQSRFEPLASLLVFKVLLSALFYYRDLFIRSKIKFCIIKPLPAWNGLAPRRMPIWLCTYCRIPGPLHPERQRYWHPERSNPAQNGV
jgi:hypothetical protein